MSTVRVERVIGEATGHTTNSIDLQILTSHRINLRATWRRTNIIATKVAIAIEAISIAAKGRREGH